MINHGFPVGVCGVALEYKHALLDAQAAAHEYGNPVVFDTRLEANVSRDEYGSIKKRAVSASHLLTNAASIVYQPTDRQLEKVGLREHCDALVTIAAQDFIDANIAFDDIETNRSTVTIQPIAGWEANAVVYEIKDKARTGQFANGYLYLAFSLVRRG